MTVRTLQVGCVRLTVTGEGYQIRGHVMPEGGASWTPQLQRGVRVLLSGGCLCNNAEIYVPRNAGRVRAEGDPTEVALLVAARKAGIDPAVLRQRAVRVAEEPFSSETRSMSVTCQEGSHTVTYMKGALETVLPRCQVVWGERGPERLTEARRRQVLEDAARMAARSLRVLALATQGLPEAEEWCLVGLFGLQDPLRPEAPRAVRRCREAGIRVVMITGDHPATAQAVGQELGLLAHSQELALGPELEALDDRALEARVEAVRVCARVSPTLKVRLVRAFRSLGHVVAMTGDGVNDAAAIREADIGVAMGQTGTEVAKEAAAMVLTDDNFATIVAAVEEGRGIYNNIRKFVRYLLSCNVGEVLVMLTAVVLGLPLPLTPIQILWVNLVTDGLPALALGMEPVDPSVMQRPPRSPQEGIFAHGLGVRVVTRGMLMAAGTLGVFVAALLSSGSLARARTLAFATLVGSQLFHVFDCRSEEQVPGAAGLGSNPYVVAAVASSAALMAAGLYLPGLSAALGTRPLSPPEVLVVLLASGGVSLLVGVRRMWSRYGEARRGLARGQVEG